MNISSTKIARPLARLQAPRSQSNSVSSRRDSFVLSAAATGVSAGAAFVALRDFTQADKFKHMGITGAATVALSMSGLSPRIAAATVFVGATVAKELIYDLMMGKGNPSLFDVSANLAGSLAGLAAVEISIAAFSKSELVKPTSVPTQNVDWGKGLVG